MTHVIYDAVSGFGGKVIMTPEFPTGTDRVAYVAERVDCDVVANIQGDEPLLEPVMLDQMIQPVSRQSGGTGQHAKAGESITRRITGMSML